MARQGRFLHSASEVKDLESRVVTSSHEFGVIWRKGHASDRIIVVPLYCFDIIEIGLPILDDTIVTRRDKPILVVRVYCRPYRNIMCLPEAGEHVARLFLLLGFDEPALLSRS